jgi:predicted amidophosphoribosyltransferase
VLRKGIRAVTTDLVDLVVPGECPGCRAGGAWSPTGVCPPCRRAFDETAVFETRPQPMPAGFPPTLAAAPYDGVMRELLLAFKERGRHQLAGPLGERLAAVAYAGLTALAVPPGTSVALVPVPDTAAAARARYGDHLRRLARPAARTLTAAGFLATISNLVRARPKHDAAALDSASRFAVAADAFDISRSSGPASAVVVLLDDIVTTGATLATISEGLAEAGHRVHFAAVLAATQRWTAPAIPNG